MDAVLPHSICAYSTICTVEDANLYRFLFLARMKPRTATASIKGILKHPSIVILARSLSNRSQIPRQRNGSSFLAFQILTKPMCIKLFNEVNGHFCLSTVSLIVGSDWNCNSLQSSGLLKALGRFVFLEFLLCDYWMKRRDVLT